MPLDTEVGLGPSYVRWGPRFPSPEWGGAPKFSAHIYCGQTAGWIKMALGMEVGLDVLEVGLSSGNLVLDPTAPPVKGHSPPIYPLWPYGWME